MTDFVARHFQTILTILIAGIATYIAYQQHRTNRNKLKLDLFDRRIKVFYALRDSLVLFQRHLAIEYNDISELRRSLIGSDFLFGKEVIEFNEKVVGWLISFASEREELQSGELEPDERKARLDRKHEMTKNLVEALDRAHDIYKPYFKLSHIR